MAMKQAPLKAQKPTEEEVEIAEVFTSPPPQATAGMPTKLPTTASPLPLVGLIGLLSFVTAGLLRLTSAHSNLRK